MRYWVTKDRIEAAEKGLARLTTRLGNHREEHDELWPKIQVAEERLKLLRGEPVQIDPLERAERALRTMRQVLASRYQMPLQQEADLRQKIANTEWRITRMRNERGLPPLQKPMTSPKMMTEAERREYEVELAYRLRS